MFCKSCKSDKLIICHRDGDIVCSSCGLVQEGHIIDDTLYGNISHTELESGYIPTAQPTTEKSNSARIVFAQASIYILGDEFDGVVTDACLSFEVAAKNHRGRCRKALSCVCFLNACKNHKTGVDPKMVYAYFQVPMWLHYSKLNLLLSTCEQQNTKTKNKGVKDENIAIKRMVHGLPGINKNDAWKVINVAYQLQQQVGCLLSKVKISKLNACLIYISCQINKHDKFNMQCVSQIYNVSIPTLKRHELLIQSALVNCKNGST